jgi:hypothetical protein
MATALMQLDFAVKMHRLVRSRDICYFAGPKVLSLWPLPWATHPQTFEIDL